MNTTAERLVLAEYGGRPSVWLSIEDGSPVLHWLIVGYVEPFDVWLHSGLSWSEADALQSVKPDLDEFLGARGERLALIELQGDDHTELSVPWTMDGEQGEVVRSALIYLGMALREIPPGENPTIEAARAQIWPPADDVM